MNIILLDDEKNDLRKLKASVEAVCPEGRLYCFGTGEEALVLAEKTLCEIAFVDINLDRSNAENLEGLSVARRLKEINPKVNIIFATGYPQHMAEALKLHASGYITKPATEEKIREKMNDLLHPVNLDDVGIYARTFGTFDLEINGRPITFSRARSREILALLIDREGAFLTRKEIAAVVFEDKDYSRKTQDYLSKAIGEMMHALREARAEHMIIHERNRYAVDTRVFSCDMYEYLKGNEEYTRRFRGEYLSAYSWAEYSLGKF